MRVVNANTAVHNLFGVALYQNGEGKAAEKAFRAALQAVPANIDALMNLVELYRVQKRYDEATECLAQAQRVAPDDIEVLSASGTLSLELGDV